MIPSVAMSALTMPPPAGPRAQQSKF
jgi:hypothetical protein